MKKRAVFLDRDGNINRDVGYPNSFRSIDIYPYSYAAVKKLNAAGFLAIVVTNQSGVARGLIEEDSLNVIHNRMIRCFREFGARIDGVYYCPHHLYSLTPRYKKDCICRKPFPGMGRQAAQDFGIDLEKSYMIGDKREDLLFGVNLGSTPILVLTGYGKETQRCLSSEESRPAFIARHLLEAVDWILEREKQKENDPHR